MGLTHELSNTALLFWIVSCLVGLCCDGFLLRHFFSPNRTAFNKASSGCQVLSGGSDALKAPYPQACLPEEGGSIKSQINTLPEIAVLKRVVKGYILRACRRENRFQAVQKPVLRGRV